MEKKQTAIQWLFLMLNNPNSDQEFANKLLNKALEIEKEQIMDSYIMGSYDFGDKIFRPTDYYNETFKSE